MKKETIIYTSPDLWEMRIYARRALLTGSTLESSTEGYPSSSDGSWSSEDGNAEGYTLNNGEW